MVFKRSVASPTATALSKIKKPGRRFYKFEHVGGLALEIRSTLITDDVDLPTPAPHFEPLNRNEIFRGKQ